MSIDPTSTPASSSTTTTNSKSISESKGNGEGDNSVAATKDQGKSNPSTTTPATTTVNSTTNTTNPGNGNDNTKSSAVPKSTTTTTTPSLPNSRPSSRTSSKTVKPTPTGSKPGEAGGNQQQPTSRSNASSRSTSRAAGGGIKSPIDSNNAKGKSTDQLALPSSSTSSSNSTPNNPRPKAPSRTPSSTTNKSTGEQNQPKGPKPASSSTNSSRRNSSTPAVNASSSGPPPPSSSLKRKPSVTGTVSNVIAAAGKVLTGAIGSGSGSSKGTNIVDNKEREKGKKETGRGVSGKQGAPAATTSTTSNNNNKEKKEKVTGQQGGRNQSKGKESTITGASTTQPTKASITTKAVAKPTTATNLAKTRPAENNQSSTSTAIPTSATTPSTSEHGKGTPLTPSSVAGSASGSASQQQETKSKRPRSRGGKKKNTEGTAAKGSTVSEVKSTESVPTATATTTNIPESNPSPKINQIDQTDKEQPETPISTSSTNANGNDPDSTDLTDSFSHARKRTITPAAVDALTAAMSARKDKADENGKVALSNLHGLIGELRALPHPPKVEGGGRKSMSSGSALNTPTSAVGEGSRDGGESPGGAGAGVGRPTAPIAIPETPSSSSNSAGGKLKADAAPFTPSYTSPTGSLATQGIVPSSSFEQGSNVHRTSFSAANAPPPLMTPPTAPQLHPQQQYQQQQHQVRQQQQQVNDFNSQETLQALTAIQTQAMLQQIIAQHGQGGLTPEVLQAVQQQASMRAMQQIAMLNQNQQGQVQQQQQPANVPPRFMNQQRGSVRDQPIVYEEEAVDDTSDFSPAGGRGQALLAPSFALGDRRRSSQGFSQESSSPERRFSETISSYGSQPQQSQSQQSQQGHQNGGLNAGVLGAIAARAHQRNGSEMSPLMQEQLELQRQIETLQETQRRLIQQQSMQQEPSALSALNNALMGQQAFQMQQETQQAALQQHYLQALMQNQNLLQAQAMLQAQAQLKAQQAAAAQQAQISAYGQNRVSSPPSQPQVTDYILSGGSQRQNSMGQNAVNMTPRQMGDMGPPAAPSTGHRRKESLASRHRPTNSIIGSFGGFVEDEPDKVFGHNRAGSRAGALGDFRFGSSGNNNAGGGQSLDLASAQTQLQLLSQFRQTQIGAGGHSKMASFSLPNMLPNLMIASTIAPVNQSIVQQQQAFQLQLQQQQGPGPQRKSLFAPYLPQGALPPLLAAGKLVVGTLRINMKNRSDAYVATDVLDADIYIAGSKDRNRALEGDIVAVELLDVEEVWASKKEKEEKKRKKEEHAMYDWGSRGGDPKRKPQVAKKQQDDIEVEGQGLVLFEDEEINDDTKPAYAGHIVAVVERMSGQMYTGQISVLRPSSAATKEKQDLERRERDGDREDSDRGKTQEAPKIIWHIATNRRTPLIAIPTNQAPSDFVDNPSKYANRLFVATIKRWPITSLHPFGSLVEEIGEIGSIEVETTALLKNCNLGVEGFADSSLRCLPPMPWRIPEREYEVRKDMRASRVFTIDPKTAKDLDDALSVTRNPDGTFEVGVHIADVSYFVKPNTALDRDARKRATSVYLVERSVPMLPPSLCEELCSLVPGVERLAFSVFFTMDAGGNVLQKKLQRTIIKSCAKLAYDDAQTVIDGGKLPENLDTAEYQPSEVESDIALLNSLAKKLRARRFKDGALKIDNVKLSFELDAEGKPVDCAVHEGREANAMVEEFMLLSNIAAAQVIAHGLPEQAILRRHEAPIQRRIEGFVERARRLGFAFDGSTSTDIQRGFDAIESTGDKLVLQIAATRSMNKAKYFCAGMLDIAKYSHFALNAPLYTHFTSPIRRYADVLVHRMLDACMNADQPETKFLMEREAVAKCAQHCNAKKDSAKIAQEQSAHLHLCHLIHSLTQQYGPVIRDAKVVNVLDSAFDVVVPEFGIEKRVHCDKVPINNHVFHEHEKKLSLYWSEQDVLSFLAKQTDDNEHLKSVRAAAGNRAGDEESGEKITSKQQSKSMKRETGKFEGLKEEDGHKIQDVKELQNVPVIVSADIMKSPPVIIVYAVNPYAAST